ncbi:DUF4240 domain-containing protein [Blastopirellula marina]|uniref:Ferredoxin n=1 Tax=Blastopirellula marina TaxID=124 RepID=A0A2S8GHM5_9BACT|nr:DUF4240 domain-containing protein [Blastopirellula marina]PQO43840.1 ferredoxin [Blastopirellula marina]
MSNEFDRGSFSPDDISQWFWDVVERADRSRDRLKAELQSMTREEVIRFDNEFQEAAVQLVDEPFLDFMEGNVSEDSAKDIADFVVSQGKKVYSEIWANPETIPTSVESGENHTLAGIASEVFWDRFKESIPQEIDFF